MYFDERDLMDINKEENDINIFEKNYTKNENKKWDNDFKINVDSININNFNRNSELFSKEEGLNKGNMFKGIYDPYKNYIYRVVVKGEKDELLLTIQQLTFKAIDLNLYLDVYPEDEVCYKEFKETIEELNKYKDLYEKNYGPLCAFETLYYNSYKWLKNPWPWMNEGGSR